MRVTLYGSRLSPFVEKTIRGVQRKGVSWELVVPKRRDDMRKWNPQTGKMPAADVAGAAYDEALAAWTKDGQVVAIDVDGTPRQGPLTVILTPRPMRVQPIPAPRRVHLGGAQGRRERP